MIELVTGTLGQWIPISTTDAAGTKYVVGKFIRDDLVGVFGSRKGPHGHDEAALDDDWPTVDRAAPVLDKRFAEFAARRAGGPISG